MRKAILAVSFGTTFAETREKNITAVERALAQQFPGLPLYSAWTSNIIRSIVATRGEAVEDVPAAMERMSAEGITEVAVLPTHLLYGDEYDKLCEQTRAKQGLFQSVRIAPPLLANTKAMQAVAHAVAYGLPVVEGEALVLMGHGTGHFCNTVYAAMDYVFKAEGFPHVFVGTVEAYPDLKTVTVALKAAGYRRALLAPLMLVAGDHAVNDMAADTPYSWRGRLQADGIACRTVARGLGEYRQVCDLYTANLRSILE